MSFPDSTIYKTNADRLLDSAVIEVNKRIAPASIDRIFHISMYDKAYRLHGRWGTFRVELMLAEDMVRRAEMNYRGDAFEWLVRELESLMAGTMQRAINDLVRAEVTEQLRPIKHQFETDMLTMVKRLVKLETSWYKRLWRWATRWYIPDVRQT